MDIVKHAQRFSVKTHKRIVYLRKYRKWPYPAHLATVAKLVSSITNNPATVDAVWPHDLIQVSPSHSQNIILYDWDKVIHLNYRSAGHINMILLDH